MNWEQRLSQYEGSPIQIWIEDRSGEEQTKPKPYTLYKIKLSEDQDYLQFYIQPTQFLTVPLFDKTLTKLEEGETESSFVSHDVHAKLLYWVYFTKKLLND
ncbi:MAG: hypothetical protein WD469_02875 [Paenibacillaceae bacterium]